MRDMHCHILPGVDDGARDLDESLAMLEAAKTDKDIVVLCSDSRGSASLTPFFDQYPQQSVEVGIAEQDLVSIAAGMASCGKKAWAASPASFVTTRSYEQCKVDVSYSNTNVKLIGISGGVSYGALGMSHHSAQDIAAMSAIPNMRVYLPSDRFQTAELGRVDAGGGGTIAYIPAKYGMDVIDSGVAVLSMHAPWEVTSKADVYEAYRAYKAFLNA